MQMQLHLGTPEHVRRVVLFTCGCGLAGFGLLPLLHIRCLQQYNCGTLGALAGSRSGGSDSCMTLLAHDSLHAAPLAVNTLTGTAFDLVACLLAAAFSVLGVGTMFLSCQLLPARMMRACLKTVGVPLALLAACNAMLVCSYYASTSVAAAWRASAQHGFDDIDSASETARYPQQHMQRDNIAGVTNLADSILEHRVNTAFCHVLGRRVCTSGSVRDAHALFSTPARDKKHKDDAHATIAVATACRAQGPIAMDDRGGDAHNYRVGLDAVCHMCRIVSGYERDDGGNNGEHRTETSRHPHKSGTKPASPLTDLPFIHSPSPLAVRWCGTFITTRDADAHKSSSPFWQHHDEVMRAWREATMSEPQQQGSTTELSPHAARLAEVVAESLSLGARLLLVLLCFALPALVVIVQWCLALKLDACMHRYRRAAVMVVV